MKKVYDTIIAVRNASGKNAKLAILQKNFGNEQLKDFLRVCYEPRINFYQGKVDKKAASKGVKRNGKFHAGMVSSLISQLHERAITGNAAKQWLADTWSAMQEDWERELLEMLIDRDVKAGISTSSINSIWSDLITDVPYMRCSLLKGSKIKEFHWKEGVYSQIKADGMFANIDLQENGDVTIMSRNGSPFPIEAFSDITEQLGRLSKKCRDVQLHGELLVQRAHLDGNETLPRQESNGMLNRLLKGGDLPSNHRVIYKVWDIIPLNESVSGGAYHVPYSKRLDHLRALFPVTGAATITIIETATVRSMEEAKEHYLHALACGEEGTVLKDCNAIWEDKTSKWQIKFKMEVAVELRVIGFKPGRNKFEGMVGSLECESEDHKLEVNVSGFPDELREEITKNFNKGWKGSVVSVISNSIMPERNGKYSLFLPRFAEQRLDKKKADTLKQIQDQFEAALDSM